MVHELSAPQPIAFSWPSAGLTLHVSGCRRAGDCQKPREMGTALHRASAYCDWRGMPKGSTRLQKALARATVHQHLIVKDAFTILEAGS